MSIILLIFGIIYIGLGSLLPIATIYRLVDERRGNKTYAFPINIKEGLLYSIVAVVVGIFFIVFHNLIVGNL